MSDPWVRHRVIVGCMNPAEVEGRVDGRSMRLCWECVDKLLAAIGRPPMLQKIMYNKPQKAFKVGTMCDMLHERDLKSVDGVVSVVEP